MADLIAQGPELHHRWRRTLPLDKPVMLGRQSVWSAPWDDHISREHLRLLWNGERLVAQSHPDARNPVFVQGREAAGFELRPGEHFVIGLTSFQVVEETADVSASSPAPREEHSFRPGDLRRIQFRNADHRLEVLSQLPQLITESTSDEMFSMRLIGLLLAGIADAEAAALVQRVEPSSAGRASSSPTVAGAPPSASTSGPITTEIVGTTLADRYLVTRKVGQGGMGAVYEATHTLIGKRVAVKVLLEKYAQREAIVKRLKQEAQLA